MTLLHPRYLLLTLPLIGCTTDGLAVDDDSSSNPTLSDKSSASNHLFADLLGDDGDPPASPVPLVADMCDEPTYSGTSWQTTTSEHFSLSALPGTPGDTERAAIAARLEAAYADIRTALGITAEPHLTVNLSPSRNAAVAHNRGFGRAWPNVGRYDVIYTGVGNSYEMLRYGQLLTVMLDFHVDPINRYRVPVLATGIAEYLDQSGRDLHAAYAQQLVAGVEARVRIAEMDSKDVNGRNYGRSGSLVQFLIDRYGMETFVDIYRASAVTWNGTCNVHMTYGCIATPDQLTSMLDGLLFTHTGDRWNDIQPLWLAEIEAAIDALPVGLDANATAEIENLLVVMDEAISNDNAAKYRTTIEGFYCDWGGDAERNAISARAVNAFGSVTTQVLALYDTGIKNFPTAQAFVMRTDNMGIPQFATFQFEQLPIGWRVTYSPDWY